jgi:multimeric flavodoxin WrbA|uniref:Flavodoxin family protein n=1 Tax=Desulfobacca acetoxidans TaxID=60893 RepID=A0A7C3WIG0_9BACT
MKILAIWASPRKGGNSEILLNSFLEGAADAGAGVEKIALRELRITPCLEIYHCFKDGTCPIKDDMQPLYEKLLAAEVVALASPIFFYSLSAQAKAMIDRTQALWSRRYHLGQDFPGPDRQGVLLCTGATKGKLLFVGARLVAKYFFDAINVTYAAEILVRGVDEKGAILEKPEVLEQAKELGRRLAHGEKLGPIRLSPLAV